jgi:signal transduction histidine kinase
MSRSDSAAVRGPRPPAPFVARLRVGQWLALSIGALLILGVISIGLALAANSRLSDRRSLLLDRISPALSAALDLENALINEETGVRGFVITRKGSFLQPYTAGRLAEAQDVRTLQTLLHGSAAVFDADLDAVRSHAAAWQRRYVAPLLHGRRSTPALDSEAKAMFDGIRRALARLQVALTTRRSQAHANLTGAARTLTATLVLTGVLIVVGSVAAAVLLRLIVTAPLARLGQEARRVSGGDFETPMSNVSGAREIVEVGADVDTMRELIVAELREAQAARGRLQEQAMALERSNVELERSNVELEQFAYVASHDLQEPLRKVTSFCQALESRYRGQLDDRADQYIHFAVDGAKRMQILINDLLAFSRVGRGESPHELIDLSEVVADVRSSMSRALDEADARVLTADLPVVRGDSALLASVFQNLIANAVKFRGPQPPLIRIDARRNNDDWEFSCSDNGIGIGPEYAERIFVIFQRLHSKESYPGTGIGLALCRKIVEHHGGSIWLDTDYVGGTRIRFTLPISEEVHS